MGVSNQLSHSEVTTLEAYCISRFVFDQLLYEKAIKSGCVPPIQTIHENNGHLQHLSKTLDYLIDARGVSAGKVSAIATWAYWMFNRKIKRNVSITTGKIGGCQKLQNLV